MFSFARTMPQRNRKWTLIGIAILFVAGLLLATAIVLSLIPLYLPAKTATYIPSTELTNLLYEIDAGELNVTLPIDSLSPAALQYLQTLLQNQLNANSKSAGSTITLVSGSLASDSSGKKKRRRRQTNLIRVILQALIKFASKAASKNLQSQVIGLINEVDLAQIGVDFIIFQNIINENTTTTTTTTTVAATSGGVASVSSYPSTTPSSGRRRRRAIIQSTQMASHMPIGGCLVIAPENSNANYKREMYKQYAFVKHLPLGVESITPVDGQQIDLYTFLRENKLSKSTYNELVKQDHSVHGHYLTLGALGCLESHVHAWERVVEVNQPMLILEDDVHFQAELIDYMLPYLLYSLPTNFSLLYFGNLLGDDMKPKLMDYNDLLWKINGSNWGTYAYLISPQAAATLLDFIYPVDFQVDSMIIDIAQSQSLDVFMSKQLLVKTESTHGRISRVQRYLVPPIVIPHIFHFIWLTNKPFPTTAQKNIEQWKKFYPNWEIKLWTNESIYNSNLTIYNKRRFEESVNRGRQASDILRYEIIYRYGGIYVDADFEPLQNIEPLLHGIEAFVAYENEYFICNGIFGAIPGHELSERLVLRLESSWQNYASATVNEQTGPFHMTRQVKAMQEEKKTTMANRFQIFLPHIFFAYAWYEQDPGHPYDPFAFAVHHFRSTAEIARDAKEGQ